MAFEPSYWDLSYEGDQLQWEGRGLAGIADEYGTPLYLLNELRLEKNVTAFVGAVRKVLDRAEIYHSVKSSGIPTLLPAMLKKGIGAEISTGHELEMCRRLGVPPTKIIFGGSNRSPAELIEAMESGIRLIVVDGLEELTAMSEYAGSRDQAVDLALRVAFAPGKAAIGRKSLADFSDVPYGFEPGSEEYEEALAIISRTPSLRLAGLHSHIGTGIHRPELFVGSVRKLLTLHADLRVRGFSPDLIDIGGGLGVPSVREFRPLELLRYLSFGRLPSPPQPSRADHMEEYVGRVGKELNAYRGRTRAPLPTILLEPGRVLTSDAVLLLLRVGAIKQRGGKRHALLDGGSMSVGLSCLAEYHEIFPVRRREGKHEAYTFGGRVPTPLDVLYRNKSFQPLERGDYLALMDAGAYMIPTAMNFSSLRPAVARITRDGVDLIRARESVDDLLRRDIHA